MQSAVVAVTSAWSALSCTNCTRTDRHWRVTVARWLKTAVEKDGRKTPTEMLKRRSPIRMEWVLSLSVVDNSDVSPHHLTVPTPLLILPLRKLSMLLISRSEDRSGFQMFVFRLVIFLLLGLARLWPHLQPSHSKVCKRAGSIAPVGFSIRSPHNRTALSARSSNWPMRSIEGMVGSEGIKLVDRSPRKLPLSPAAVPVATSVAPAESVHALPQAASRSSSPSVRAESFPPTR
jgi:hypothetical protein